MIYRIDVHPRSPADQRAGGADDALLRAAQEICPAVGAIHTSRIFLIDTDAPPEQIVSVATALLADPLVEVAHQVSTSLDDGGASRVEIHLKPGVMDPVAASTELALAAMGVPVRQVRTGRAFVLHRVPGASELLQPADLQQIAGRVLANGVIEFIHYQTYLPAEFDHAHERPFVLQHVRLLELDEKQLNRLSRDGHLFLSLAEMKAIQHYFTSQGREPTDVELETIAQTWSEHCVHKTLKSAVDVEEHDAAGNVVGRRRYGNLIKETIFQSTMELMGTEPSGSAAGSATGSAAGASAGRKKDFCLSVFADNAGVVAFDETDAICFKAETHNHPSAIEPYGGAATGAGGVIRDILGTGLGAKPIANTDVFCVADPNYGKTNPLLNQHSAISIQRSLPKGVIHPRRVLEQVVAGVRDYGNRMGIPTVNGAVYFDKRYLGNPLVFCGCVGLIPRDKLAKAARDGDAVVLLGGRTGRDGIHGATFSSAELTDTHADEFSHAVQIGNAITEKKVADVILQARDAGLFTAVTDCGAGGLSSAVGEMGEKIGATVELGRVPLKYAGLRYDEIWISEAQERMVLAVPPSQVAALQQIATDEDVEATVIGTFGTPGRELVLQYRGEEVGRLSMHFLHDGIPMPTRKAVVPAGRGTGLQPVRGNPELREPPFTSFLATEHGLKTLATAKPDFRETLLKTLAHPNIASKHWIIRQYDHEVQGGSVVKPLVGPLQIGPSDAAVVRPKLGSFRGVAIGCGLAPQIEDPYQMALAAIDEAIRNVICVGADYNQIAILDNFCWPSVDDELTMGTLVRACEACRDAARAYGIPFISGKDSLHNQFTVKETGQVIRIPNTLLISAIGIVPDVRKCVTMDFKKAGKLPHLVWAKDPSDLRGLAVIHSAISGLISVGAVEACHDVSEGGYATAVAEMAIASGIGLYIRPDLLANRDPFAERLGSFVLQFSDELLHRFIHDKLINQLCGVAEVAFLGKTLVEPRLVVAGSASTSSISIPIDELTRAWRGTLDW